MKLSKEQIRFLALAAAGQFAGQLNDELYRQAIGTNSPAAHLYPDLVEDVKLSTPGVYDFRPTEAGWAALKEAADAQGDL